jgi:hypothetical protein
MELRGPILRDSRHERKNHVFHLLEERIVQAARLYGKSRPAQITISASATTHHSNGFQAHRAILLLAALCGNLDVKGGNRPWSNRFIERSVDVSGSDTRAAAAAMGAKLCREAWCTLFTVGPVTISMN